MIKKDLLSIPETVPPEEYKFCNCSGYIGKAQTFLLYPEKYISKSVLNIDLYGMTAIAAGEATLLARYFACASERKFIVYIPGLYEWKEIGIDNAAHYLKRGCLSTNGNYWWRPSALWDLCEEEDGQIVRDYLRGTGTESIQRWENEIRSDSYYAKLNRRQRKINKMMDEKIPILPDGFYTWVHETVFGREYLFQKKEEKKTRLFCTACAKEWTGKAIKSGYTTCPKCGHKVLASFGEEQESKEEQLFILQPCEDQRGDWVERTFRAKAYWQFGRKRIVKWDEQIRIIIPPLMHFGKCYYEIGITGDGPEYSDRNTYQKRLRAGYLYPGNLDELDDCWPESVYFSGITEMARKGLKINYNKLILGAERWPWMEYLVKGRFYRLTEEIVNESRHLNMGLLLEYRVRSPKDLLRLGSSQVDRLRQMNGGFVALSWLQHEYKTGEKVSHETLKYFEKLGLSANGSNMQQALKYLTPNALVNYIKKQMQQGRESGDSIYFEAVLSTYADYLDMAEKQGLNLKHEIFYKPKDLNAAHNACVIEGQKHEMEYRAAEILKQFPDIQKNLDEIRDKYSYEDDQFCIMVPAGIVDILREGRSLGHCIDTTDRYFDRINQHISYLVFLRRKENPEKSYYTLEIEPGGTVRQQRTTGNNQNKEEVEEYTPFIRKWQQEVKSRLTEADRQQAEVSRDIRIKEYQDLRERKEKVWHGKLAGQLLADVLEGDLIESAG